jgi:hypothetical protein
VPRSRGIKPGFFTDAGLVDLPFQTRLLFIGLWTLADRAGRLKDKPKQIKMQIFPADNVDVEASLGELAGAGFIIRYQRDNESCIQIRNFTKHQHPHWKEPPSAIKPPDGGPVESPADGTDPGLTPGETGAKRRKARTVRRKSTTGELPEGFAEFWAVYPRKEDKEDAAKAWKQLDPNAELQAVIIADVRRRAAGEDWQKEDGRYVTKPLKYIRNRKWEEAPVGTNGQPHVGGDLDTVAFAKFNEQQRAEGRS